MNSSGIKRGLATTAVSALAIAGLPLFASSASAATGDSITIVSVSPVRNGGDQGVFIQATLKNVTPGDVKIADSSLADLNPDTPSQTIGTISVVQTIANNTPGDSNPNDGLPEAIFRVTPITTSADGGEFKFALFEDEGTVGTVDAADARVQVTGTTAGEVKAVTVSPASQSAPLDTDSGDYTLSFVDSAGRATQLTGAETTSIALANGFAGATVSDSTITADETRYGARKVTAKGSSLGLKTFEFSGPATATGGTFNLDVLKAASGISVNEIDVQAGVDDFDGFGDQGTYNFANNVAVRIDQTSVTIAVKDTSANTDNANATLQLSGAGVGTVKFDGKASTTKSTVLNEKGEGSITFTPDAGTIKENSGIDITTPDGDVIKIRFQRAMFDAVMADADSYVSKFGGSVDVTLTSMDQFGLPIAGQYLAVQRVGGVNADANPSATKVTGADGKATFTLTDTKATAVSFAPDDVRVLGYDDQFDNTPTPLGNQAKIYYTADGQGAEFAITVDGVTPAGAAYDPASVSVNPLTDGVANDGGDSTDEDILLDTSGGTPGVPVTVSADNGALILKGADSTLDKAKAEQTGVIGDNFEIIGTKTGLVTLTVTSGGKTKTAQVTVKKLTDNSTTARNISVSGPTEAVGGETVAFAVKVTDAFGNPVAGFTRGNLNVTVSGPGAYQDGDAMSNADGVINLNVRLDEDADSAVTLNVTVPNTVAQFGAAANRVKAGDPTNTGPGLPASVTSSSATISDVTDIAALEQAVEDAEEALAEAQENLAIAQGNLDVASTELMIAQENVDSLQAKKQNLREKLNKAKAKGNKQKAKTTRKKLRTVKRNLRAAKDELTVAEAKVDAAQAIVEIREGKVADAEADLAEAEQNLEDAQG
ncbi:MAG: hypothetical protein KKE65_06240 [Actinobacteria bacterium]|nr:hypothetical protein [Actinomycetota bacterium]MBU2111239.1 hypothetical protein [Actinomycetota bacterium]